MKTLDNRLRERGTENAEALRIKIQTAREEMKAAAWFDYRVVNHDDMLDDAVSAIDRIVSRETTPVRGR
jgi:guanylate kinase